jgi:hypothetical protein
MTVVIARACIEPELLRAMDGRSFFAHAVDIGMIGERSVARNEVGLVKVSGAEATGEAVVRGKPVGMHWRFEREAGAWRLDVTSALPKATQAFAGVIHRAGQTENEFILRMIAEFEGDEPGEEIWQPVGR